ncbi:MAG: hypothetical protein IJX02_03810 [Clostridia bacterium]|nr:hypothetical protein [Clostridia bacterium]
MKGLFKSIISIILAISFVFSAVSCAAEGIATEIERQGKDSTQEPIRVNEVSNGKGSYAQTVYENPTYDFSYGGTDEENGKEALVPEIEKTPAPQEKPQKEPTVSGDASDREQLTEADYLRLMEDLKEWRAEEKRMESFSLAIDCIAYDLYMGGYDVFKAVAVVNDQYVPGIAFASYQVYESTESGSIYGCGFVQIYDDASPAELVVTRETVENGLVVLPFCEGGEEQSFVVNMGVSLDSFSGIYNGYYFRYDQESDYCVKVTLNENKRSLWDEEIDLYSYDDGKYMFKGDMYYSSTSAVGLYSDEARAYAVAREAIDKIIEEQEKNAYAAEPKTIILFSQDVIEEYLLNKQEGTINGFLLEQINDIELEENQFVVVTTEGVGVHTVVDTDEISRQRLTNGIIGLIGSALLVAGSVFLTVVTCGAGTPLTVGSVVLLTAAAGATVYGVSQMVESVQEIYYGAIGDITSESINPVLECFKAVIPDEKMAETIYHVWGISCSLIQSLVCPANAALGLARTAGMTAWQTTLAVTRAVVVELAKIAVSGLVAVGVGCGADTLVTALTGDKCAGQVAGFISGALAAAFTYNGLNKLDAKFNFSGLHSKGQVAQPKGGDTSESNNSEYTTENGRGKRYEDWTRDDYMNNIDDPDLKHTAEKLYRENATVGDGGTADAVRYTKQTGELVGGSDHIIKAQETVTHLESLINSGKLSYHDTNIAKSLMSDLIHALMYLPK